MNGLDKSLERLIRVSVESKTSYHLFIGCGFDYNHKFFQGDKKLESEKHINVTFGVPKGYTHDRGSVRTLPTLTTN
jgi:hypothetical protein